MIPVQLTLHGLKKWAQCHRHQTALKSDGLILQWSRIYRFRTYCLSDESVRFYTCHLIKEMVC